MFQDSSAIERSPVKRVVVGLNPTPGATRPHSLVVEHQIFSLAAGVRFSMRLLYAAVSRVGRRHLFCKQAIIVGSNPTGSIDEADIN